LGDTLAIQNDDLSEDEQKQECLQDVYKLASKGGIDAERQIAVVSNRELERIKT
jgi:hypothetical protein